jgi:hypothetical protein
VRGGGTATHKFIPGLSNAENPWIKFSGIFKDDPMFDEVLNDIEQYRQELDAELDAQADSDMDGAA